MRHFRIPAALGLIALAAPALAHSGSHVQTDAAHFLAQHGIAAGLVGFAVIIGGVVLLKRKG